MKALIIEDEAAASRRLARILQELAPDIVIADTLETITDSVAWLTVNDQPDVIFCDIHLADGSCFNIFSKVKVSCPVIFITAYDKYAIDAFRVNSIDYLLKPVKNEELSTALHKLREFSHRNNYDELIRLMMKKQVEYPKRLVVRTGQFLKAVEMSQIALFYSENGVVFLVTFDGRRLIPDLTLEKIVQMVDPKHFYRINRSQIINIDAIAEMHLYTKGRIKVILKLKSSVESIVSSERTQGFRTWLSGE